MLKTGKEADVHLVRRAVPDTDRSCLLAVKRYRAPEHRLFHRDAGYLEGSRVRRSRLAQLRPGPIELRGLWTQLVDVLMALTGQLLCEAGLR